MAQYAMFFQKYDPRVTYFDKLIFLMKDTGIYDYLLRRQLPYMGMKEYEHYEEEKLVIEHYYIPIGVLLFGLSLGMVIVACEIKQWRKLSRA